MEQVKRSSNCIEYFETEQEKNQKLQETLIGQEMTRIKLENIQKDLVINTLGQELTKIKLQLLQGGM